MLRRLDGRRPCVQRGSEPTLRDNSVSFVWNSEVAGKSMIEFLRAHEPEFFGPRGKVRIKSFEARAARSAIFNSAVGENAAASQPAPGVHSSGPDDGTYCPLPTTLASNSLDHSRWFDKAAVFDAFEAQGFLHLRAFVPDFMVARAYRDGLDYVLDILGSFTEGHAINSGDAGINDMQALPSKIWERRCHGKSVITFGPGPAGFEVGSDGHVTKVEHDGQAQSKGVKVGWLATGTGTDTTCSPASVSAAIAKEGGFKMTFEAWEFYSPYALRQKWGVSTSRGYQPALGLGKCMQAENTDILSIRAVQYYLKCYAAFLHQCCPEDLCWRVAGFSVKPEGSKSAPAHRDEHDLGRNQIIVALSDGAFDIWPGSHKLAHRPADTIKGHYHIANDFQQYLETQCERVVFSCKGGDVLVFKGGSFVHGSPAVTAANPSPRVMTYCTFWPPGTEQGNLHAAKKCQCKLPY